MIMVVFSRRHLNSEEAVLGALMIEKDAYSLVSEILRPESFYERRHQLILFCYHRSCGESETGGYSDCKGTT